MPDFIIEDGVLCDIAEKVQKHLDEWAIDVIYNIDMYYHYHSYTAERFGFKAEDAVLKNGELVGFNFYGTFVSVLDADKELTPPDIVVEMVGKPTCRYYDYSVKMKLIKR